MIVDLAQACSTYLRGLLSAGALRVQRAVAALFERLGILSANDRLPDDVRSNEPDRLRGNERVAAVASPHCDHSSC